MTKKIFVEYDSKKCIGAKRCIEIAPERFSFNGKIAILNNSEIVNSLHHITIEVTLDQLQNFKYAAESCPVNAIRISDEEKELVSTKINENEVKLIKAEYDDLKEFVLDPKGYFLIRINSEKKKIEVGFCNSRNKIVIKVEGNKPIDIYNTIINKIGLDIRKDHCAYLGRELQKAYISLQKDLSYVQDDELVF